MLLVPLKATIKAVMDWKKDIDQKLGTEEVQENGTTTWKGIPAVVLANKCDLIKGVNEALEVGARMESVCNELGFLKW